MRGFLRGMGRVVPLCPKVTTIGREGCDLIIDAANVDPQHAVVELSEAEQCFIIQDLNSSGGTFINDCRIHNAAVRLAPGDVIKFGSGGNQYVFECETFSQVTTIPPMQGRTAQWAGPLTVINSVTPSYGTAFHQGTHHTGVQAVSNRVVDMQGPGAYQLEGTMHATVQPVSARVTTLRQRPLSAGARGRTLERPQMAPVGTFNAGSVNYRTGVANGWMSAGGRARASPPVQQPRQSFDDSQVTVIQEKEQRILQLSEEVARLRTVETQLSQRDAVITNLQSQLMSMEQQLAEQRSTDMIIEGPNAELSQRLQQLEAELAQKREEVTSLQQQLEQERASARPVTASEETTRLRAELDRVTKDKSITSGLVTQMQANLASKDTSISRLTREIEGLKKELRARETELANLSAKRGLATSGKMTRLQSSKISAEDYEAKEQEVANTKQKLRLAEAKVTELKTTNTTMKAELEKLTKSDAEFKQTADKLGKELEASKSECADLQRSERMVRVDLEQALARVDRFKRRVVQVTYSTPGIRAPDEDPTDDTLVSQIKTLIDERTDLSQQLKTFKDDQKQDEKEKKTTQAHVKKLKEALAASQGRLTTSGRLSKFLRKEITLLSSVSVDESLQWVRDAAVTALTAETTAIQGIEDALDAAGVNVKLSDEPLSAHIANLRQQLETVKKVAEESTGALGVCQAKHKEELEHKVQVLTAEWQSKLTEATERVKLEGEEKLNRAIDDIRAVEEEKRESAVEAERRRIEELQETVEKLKKSLVENEEEMKNSRDTAKEAVDSLEQFRKMEEELKASLEAAQQISCDDKQQAESQMDDIKKKLHEECNTYKEQIKQHSITICNLEERVSKLQKKNKDMQVELTSAKQELTQLRNKPQPKTKPPPPPKPQMVIQRPPPVDVQRLEATIVALKEENVLHLKTIKEQEELVTALRRDLQGAAARLSDIKGEMTEGAKQELERVRGLVREREGELLETRQQLASLSQLVDKLKQEAKDKNNETTKLSSQLTKYKKRYGEKEARVKELEAELEMGRENLARISQEAKDEGRISQELTAAGAQCRGERHGQTIARQKEALAELRGRLRVMEQSKPPLPNKEQALQEVIILKRELAEMRAQQALAGDPATRGLLQPPGSVEHTVSRARGAQHASQVETDMERSAHRETMDALDASEKTYLSLMRNMAVSLEMEEAPGLKSIAHIPRDERDRILSLRVETAEAVSSRVRTLQERIRRKDELLQGYEQDLARLRQAEELASKRSGQLDTLEHDMRSKSEETTYLRESLTRARDKLDQEKRLNTAVKQRKAYYTETSTPSHPRAHHCPPQDPTGARAARRRREADKLKRKGYEVQTLKKELAEKEEMLYTAERRLDTVSSAATPAPEEPVAAQ